MTSQPTLEHARNLAGQVPAPVSPALPLLEEGELAEGAVVRAEEGPVRCQDSHVALQDL